MSSRSPLPLLIVLALAAAGCAGAELRGRTGALREVIKKARDNGAYRCAPRELAMAESHAAFAEQELDEGDYYRARQEIDVADINAQEAVRKSPRDRCAPMVAMAPPTEMKVQRLDTDKDGLYDDEDACPTEPEDKDGFQDNDGCPDPDNDKDKLLDPVDKCPNEYAETEDGCPKKYQLIVVTEKKIELKQTIYFDFNKATIKPVSFPLLNEVAMALKDNSKIRVRIEGHTDSRGNDAFNLKLSQRRTESVRTFLISAGIAPDRMEPRGYGETVPIADNRTDAGRAQNRRVEFIIISQ